MYSVKFTIIATVFVLSILCSCSSDDGSFSRSGALSVEEGKQRIENSGHSFLDAVEEMEGTNSMKIYKALIHFLDQHDPLEEDDYYGSSEGFRKVFGIQTAYALAECETEGMDVILKSMLLDEDDPETLQDEMDRLSGIYTWRSAYNEWQVAENQSDDIVFHFPSTKGGSTNNATYTITYDGQYINGNRFDNEYDGDFPKRYTASLTKENNEVSSGAADFRYDAEGSLIKFDFAYTVDEYIFESSFDNSNNRNATAQFQFMTHDGLFLSLKVSASGNWSDDNVDNNTRYYVEYYDYNNGEWTEVEVGENDDYDYLEMDVDKVVIHGNIDCQVMDVQIVGEVEINHIYRELYEIDENWEYWDDREEERGEEEVDILNRYMNLSLVDATNNRLIADCEAYLIEEEDSYYWGNEYYTDYDYYPGLRFIFGDGSKIDAETYFDTDFDEMLDDMEEFIDDIEDEYDY